MTTVMVFGTFDGLHAGHNFFLHESKKFGDRLVAVVARDVTARLLKGREPIIEDERRRHAVAEHAAVDEAVLGDVVLGSYDVIRQIRPDVIAIGHDQHALEQDLSAWAKKENVPLRFERIARYD